MIRLLSGGLLRLDAPFALENVQGDEASGAGQSAVPVGTEIDEENLRRGTAAVQPREQVGGALFDHVPIALRVGAEQLVPGGLGVHRSLLLVVELPGKRNAGETAEVFRLVPGELAAEILVALLPEEP